MMRSAFIVRCHRCLTSKSTGRYLLTPTRWTNCTVYRQCTSKPVYGDDYYRYLSSTEQLAASPLHGVTVLDMSRVLAGPLCTMILGDMGAEVLKIEKPGTGDDTRTWGPPWVGNESAYFLSVNRNKKSLAIDYTTKEGNEIIQQLVLKSDVLVENYLPGKLSKYKLDYDSVKQNKPDVIYCSISGFGQTGPYKNRGGYDNIAISIGGLMHITGPEDGEPCRTGVAVIDMSTGLYAVGAIVAALLHRKNTGRGQHIQCNLLSTQLALLSHIASNWLNCGVDSKRLGTAHPSLVPYQAFPTSDGRYIMIGAGSNHQFEELCRRLRLDELISDQRYNSNNNRVANREALVALLTKRFKEKPIEEWLSAFEGVSFPYGPVNNIQQAFNDPQVLHNESIQQMYHSTVGNVKLTGPAVRYSDSANVLQYPPPVLGEHTRQTLHQHLRYPLEKIERLHRDGIVHCADV